MFTGIVTHAGVLDVRSDPGEDMHLAFHVPGDFLDGVRVGDSISVSGVCLTVTESGKERFGVDVSAETLDRTTLGALEPGGPVNLERAMRLGERLDGHLVSGHVDGVAELQESVPEGRSRRMVFKAPSDLMRYIAPKGSVCLDGVSLTVNSIAADTFSICVIPHTLNVTTLGRLDSGSGVNLEVDLVARYLERLQGGIQQ